jgi:hypothetical protein
MNFLRIIEVLAIIFLLKIYFLFLLFNLNDLWTGRQFLENPGGSAQDILDSVHSKNGRWVDSLVSRGSLTKVTAEGVWCTQGCWIRSGGHGLDRYFN